MVDDPNTRTPIKAERASGRNFDLLEAPDHQQVHADGVTGFALSPILSRIDFFRLVRVKEGEGANGEPLEIREQHVTLVLPTAVFAEFISNSIKGLRQNEVPITEAMDAQAQNFRAFISSMGASDADKR